MQHFSLYHTAQGLLYKTACQLVEKSYHSNLKIIVLTSDKEEQEHLNKIIWTYSRRQFIPHGSKLDPLPEKQPVYLTCELENPNQATILIIIAPFNIEKIFSQKDYINHFQRIIIIYEALDNLNMLIRLLTEFASSREFVGDMELKNPSAYGSSSEDSSLGSMHKLPAEELCKKSISKISDQGTLLPMIDCYKQNSLGVWSKQEYSLEE